MKDESSDANTETRSPEETGSGLGLRNTWCELM